MRTEQKRTQKEQRTEEDKKRRTNNTAAVYIKAKLNISANVLLVENKQRIRNLKRQYRVDVYKKDDEAITLEGNLRSLSLALDKLLQWTNETSVNKIVKNGQEKGDFQGTGNQTICGFLHTLDEDRNLEPNQMRDGERQNTRDLKSSSQKRALEVGGKSKNVSGARGGCQYSGHKMYPNILMASGNIIDEQNMQSKEPITPSPDTFKDLKYFPIAGADSLMMTTKEGIKVYVYQGNLCYVDVQGIITSSNEYMNHSAGLLSVLAKEAGEKMLDDCRSYLAYNLKLQQGKVCVTTAGNLKQYTCILYACAPIWSQRKDTDSYIEELINVIRTAVISVNNNKLGSVAIAAIGSAITQYSSKNGKTTSIKEIHFVDRDLEVVTLMQTAFLLDLDESHHEKDSKLLKIPKNQGNFPMLRWK
ncbi:unnamed protein product [Mytilus edulis]|uniref:Macro domain-containing protein n=1 Tax=Mytilus edulis TaxID=6550 RepID=A0A8S3UYF4_MYTED|nr:unnamed protein product [Mytilus edulis]